MARDPIPTWCFSLAVVRKGRRFLVVQERKHGQLWFLPAGRVEPGESFVEGAERETLEETGVPITVEGILRVEHQPSDSGRARMRVFFVARPRDDTEPKSEPDKDSLQARWVTLEELDELPMRGREVKRIFQAVEKGAPIYPLSLLATEGGRW